LEDEVESEELKCQFSQVEEDLNLQNIPKSIPISNKKKLIAMKDKNEKTGKKIHYV
jgi:hypothetical protein